MQVEGAIWRVDSHRGFPKSAISDGGPLCLGMGLLCLVVHSGVPFCLGAAVLSAWEGLLCLGCPLWGGGSLHGDFSTGDLVLSAWRGPLWGFYPPGEFSAGGRCPLCPEVSFLRPLCRGSPRGSPLWHLMPGSPRAAFVSRALTRAFPSLASEASGGEASRLPWLAQGTAQTPRFCSRACSPDPARMTDRRRHGLGRTSAASAGPRRPTSRGAACVGAAMTSCPRSPAPAP